MCSEDCLQQARQKEARIQRADAIIERIGTSRDRIIPLLQALQDEFSYLPSDVLERVYLLTDIDRAQMMNFLRTIQLEDLSM